MVTIFTPKMTSLIVILKSWYFGTKIHFFFFRIKLKTVTIFAPKILARGDFNQTTYCHLEILLFWREIQIIVYQIDLDSSSNNFRAQIDPCLHNSYLVPFKPFVNLYKCTFLQLKYEDATPFHSMSKLTHFCGKLHSFLHSAEQYSS